MTRRMHTMTAWRIARAQTQMPDIDFRRDFFDLPTLNSLPLLSLIFSVRFERIFG
jgi:hypothetical protein